MRNSYITLREPLFAQYQIWMNCRLRRRRNRLRSPQPIRQRNLHHYQSKI